MLDLNKSPKKVLVSVVRQLEVLRGRPAGSIATLTRAANQKLQATISELAGSDFTVGDDARVVAREPAKPAPAPKPTKPARPAKLTSANGTTNGATTPPRDGVITVLIEGNPKHEGSASYARYALLRSGITVSDYLAAAGSRGRRTLQKALRQGHVSVEG